MQIVTRSFLFSMLFALCAVPAQAALPNSLDFDGNTLTLNGKGMRKVAMLSMYEGGLYLTANSSDGNAIAAADQPMSIRLDIVSGMITSEKMEEALSEGLENSTGGNIAPIQAHVDAFMAVFQEKIEKGDVFDIAYLPGKGMDIYKNGTFKATIDGGMEFKKAIFGIWLGDKPADKNLKKGMLGK